MKKSLALVLALVMVFALAACGGSAAPASTEAAPAAGDTGYVYWLNMKPEADEALQALAAAYTAETGVPCKIVTAASGTYSDTQTAEMAKSEAPTLFNVGNMSALADWEDYCLTLDGSDVMDQLTTKDWSMPQVRPRRSDGFTKASALSPTRLCWSRPATRSPISRTLIL